jgi:hypothetical protein
LFQHKNQHIESTWGESTQFPLFCTLGVHSLVFHMWLDSLVVAFYHAYDTFFIMGSFLF